LEQRERGQFFDVSQADAPACRLEEQFFADAADGQLDDFSPLGAALVASGVGDAESLRRYEQKAAALAEELRQSGRVVGATRQRAEAIFDFMHNRVLRGGYRLECTDLRMTLDDGRFNCVSASVLFNYLAGELGLECRALELPGHAMSRVLLRTEKGDSPHLPERPKGCFAQTGTVPFFLDVETTCARWFRLIGDPKKQVAAAAKTIGAAAAADRTKAREVSPIQVAAMIYYNRGVDLLGEKRFADATAANAKALRLDPQNATARGNLLAAINNWSIDLGNAGQFGEAVDLLRQGLTLDAKFEAFAQNYVHVHHQWVERLCRAGQYDQALDVLSRAVAEMPDQQYLRRAQGEVSQRWASALADGPAGGSPVRLPCAKRNSPVD
jgi:tetratricopeptide (TPR) repeat protein